MARIFILILAIISLLFAKPTTEPVNTKYNVVSAMDALVPSENGLVESSDSTINTPETSDDMIERNSRKRLAAADKKLIDRLPK